MKRTNLYQLLALVILAATLSLTTGLSPLLHVRICHYNHADCKESAPSHPEHRHGPLDHHCQICQFILHWQEQSLSAEPSVLLTADNFIDTPVVFQSEIISSISLSSKISRAPPTL